jgi:hypothetical protein
LTSPSRPVAALLSRRLSVIEAIAQERGDTSETDQ